MALLSFLFPSHTSDVGPRTPVTHLGLQTPSQDGSEVQFKVKKTTKFSKVRGRCTSRLFCSTDALCWAALHQIIEAYCAKKGTAPDQIRLLFDGHRIGAEETPDQVLADGVV